jgi:cytochrome oxidase Cu insertion factor (SCO1/SenC/PrrC family)
MPASSSSSRPAKRGFLLFLVGLAIVLGALGFEYWRLTTDDAGSSGGGTFAAAIGGPFTLVDQDGQVRRDTDFRGKLMLVYFGYTYCPDACPTELQTISQAMDALGGKADQVVPLFISVDPARDTPAQLKSYAESFTPRLVALTGTAEQVAQAARGYKIYYQKVEQKNGEYLMDHSSFVFLMGRDGRYLAHFTPNSSPDAIAQAIEKNL